MRPRGESISSPHSTYVGHVGRQKPQCTHLSISDGAGGCSASNADVGLNAALTTSPDGSTAAGRLKPATTKGEDAPTHQSPDRHSPIHHHPIALRRFREAPCRD